MQLETPRLLIRPFVAADLPQFTRLLEMPEVPGWQMQRGRAAEFLAWQMGNYAAMDIQHGIVCLGVFLKATGEIVGAVGAGEHDDLHESEICYNVLPAHRGQGYATEAAAAVTDWALARYPIPYLIGTAEVSNVASQRVLERCGYRFIDERALAVHLTGETYRFRYYRRERAAR
jgi:ribosomal-protein-alanine N-acetyltransferase